MCDFDDIKMHGATIKTSDMTMSCYCFLITMYVPLYLYW